MIKRKKNAKKNVFKSQYQEYEIRQNFWKGIFLNFVITLNMMTYQIHFCGLFPHRLCKILSITPYVIQ